MEERCSQISLYILFQDIGIGSYSVCNRCSQISVYIVFQDMGIGSNSVCKGDVHRFLCKLCLRILVFGHTQCVIEMFTDFCIYCVSGYWHWVILSV